VVFRSFLWSANERRLIFGPCSPPAARIPNPIRADRQKACFQH
jgi:hypothetical protein